MNIGISLLFMGLVLFLFYKTWCYLNDTKPRMPFLFILFFVAIGYLLGTIYSWFVPVKVK